MGDVYKYAVKEVATFQDESFIIISFYRLAQCGVQIYLGNHTDIKIYKQQYKSIRSTERTGISFPL